jgi:hypothetical protein
MAISRGSIGAFWCFLVFAVVAYCITARRKYCNLSRFLGGVAASPEVANCCIRLHFGGVASLGTSRADVIEP